MNSKTHLEDPPAPADSSKHVETVDALLADARRLIGDPSLNSEPAAVCPTPPSPLEVPVQSNALEEMSAQVRALTEEVKLLRDQLDSDLKGSAPETSEEELAQPEYKPDASGGSKALSIISNILFYAAIIGFVLGVFLFKSGSEGRPTMIAGYSAFTVLTSSMEDVYPKGSLIITSSVDADELEVGDDITFMVSETTSITHRIVGITEEYLNTGQRAFETQGIMNEKPDKEMVAAANVVGKVIFCSKTLGDAASLTKNNWPLLIFCFVVIAALICFLKWNARRPEDDHSEKPSRSGRKSKKKPSQH